MRGSRKMLPLMQYLGVIWIWSYGLKILASRFSPLFTFTPIWSPSRRWGKDKLPVGQCCLLLKRLNSWGAHSTQLQKLPNLLCTHPWTSVCPSSLLKLLQDVIHQGCKRAPFCKQALMASHNIPFICHLLHLFGETFPGMTSSHVSRLVLIAFNFCLQLRTWDC